VNDSFGQKQLDKGNFSRKKVSPKPKFRV